jgi:hypothetical protein
MTAGNCWGKNTIDPSGRGIKKPRKATLTFFLQLLKSLVKIHRYGHAVVCVHNDVFLSNFLKTVTLARTQVRAP